MLVRHGLRVEVSLLWFDRCPGCVFRAETERGWFGERAAISGTHHGSACTSRTSDGCARCADDGCACCNFDGSACVSCCDSSYASVSCSDLCGTCVSDARHYPLGRAGRRT
jgi:hypothetical protein